MDPISAIRLDTRLWSGLRIGMRNSLTNLSITQKRRKLFLLKRSNEVKNMDFNAASRLRGLQSHWLVTGAAGFIGSNLVETLLKAGQRVTGFDSFATGYQHNLDEVEQLVGPENWQRFRFIKADIRQLEACHAAMKDVDYVLHQAALGSVPRSLADPIASHEANVTGFLNMLVAARDAHVKNFIYAASSSTYGDDPALPKVEDRIGASQSPYAVTKLANELYADVFRRCYDFPSTGLRYFNVFGRRQDPEGAYAAVIPKWTASMIANEPVTINGDGETSRDFCYVANAVQANILAALSEGEARGQIFNVAVGSRTSLKQLFSKLREVLGVHQVHYNKEPVFAPFRLGDVRHSVADISKARKLLGYSPTHTVDEGLREAMGWYIERARTVPA